MPVAVFVRASISDGPRLLVRAAVGLRESQAAAIEVSALAADSPSS